MKPNENTERLHDMTQLIKRMSAFLLCLMLLMGAFTETALAAPDWPSGVSIQAESGIVIDADTGTVLWGQNIHNQYFPASITKIMTALIVIEKCSLDETVTFSHNAVFNVEAGSSNAGINEGDKLSVKDCLYALLLKSANESANALAEHVAGSTEAFADMMNAKAKELGCTDTHFANPSGLNNPEHYTSTYDMALIARAAFLNPTFEEIDSTTYYKLPPNSINPEGLTIYPGHKMLKKSTPYYYPGIVGGKTGYTTLAGNTLVTCAERDGVRLIAVIMKSKSTQYTDTSALLDYGFALKSGGSQTAKWQQEGAKWYFVKNDGNRAANEWMTIDGADYWFDSDGTMATGWRHYSNDAWYYFKSGGAMASSTWVESDGQWFYLGADGAMMKNTVTPDGYTLDASGVWVK